MTRLPVATSSPLARALRGAWLALATTIVAGWAAGPCAAAPALPTDLDLVPRDAAAFIHVRAADLWKSEALIDLRRIVEKAGPEALKTFTGKFVPNPSSIERLSLVMLTPRTFFEDPFPRVDPEAVSALVIIRTAKPYDRLKVMQSLGGREKAYRRNVYYFNEAMWSGLVLIDNQTFLIGSEDALVQYFDQTRARPATGPLQRALEQAAGKHQLTMGVNPQLLAKDKRAQGLPGPLQRLLEANCATFTVDVDKEMRAGLRMDYEQDAQAQAGEAAVRGALDLARDGIAQGIQEMERVLKKKDVDRPAVETLPENFAAVMGLGILRDLDGLLKAAPIKRDGTVVEVALTYKTLGGNTSLPLFLAAVSAIGTNSYSTFEKVGSAINSDGKNPMEEHLKKLAEALEKYHKDKGAYPPSATYDKDGRPLLSWRVALLPYLGEEGLYKEFQLDEPWDSLRNKRLLKRLPKVYDFSPSYSYYGPPMRRLKTTDVLFTGPDTAFAGKKGLRKVDVGDKTILVANVAVDASVLWTKPADLDYVDDQPLPNVFSKYGGGGLNVLLVDGTFKTFAKNADEKALRALIKRSAKKTEPK
jgi:hypothetical protein